MLGPDGTRRTADEELEDFLFRRSGPLGKVEVAPGFYRFLVVRSCASTEQSLSPRIRSTGRHGAGAPLTMSPAGGTMAAKSNSGCYSYSSNYRTDTFAQPGRAAGAMYTALICASVRPAAIADDLSAKPGAKNRCPEADTWSPW